MIKKRARIFQIRLLVIININKIILIYSFNLFQNYHTITIKSRRIGGSFTSYQIYIYIYEELKSCIFGFNI